MNQLVPLASATLPALVAAAGDRAGVRFLEFFLANIRNLHTRRTSATTASGARHHGLSQERGTLENRGWRHHFQNARWVCGGALVSNCVRSKWEGIFGDD